MTNNAGCWESFKVEGSTLLNKVKELVREGNIRRVVIEHQGRTIAEFPLTAGVVGAVLAPALAAIGAIAAVIKDCTIHIEHAAAETGDSTSTVAGEATSTQNVA